MNNTLTWREFEQFYLDYCVGYWSPERITLPYGDFLPLHPADDASMLYTADLTKAAPEVILADVQKLGRQNDLPIGFYISPSWQGDVDAFKQFLEANGYKQSRKMISHVLDLKSANISDAKEHSSNFEMAPTNDAHLVASIFQQAFKCPDDMAQQVVNHLERRDFTHRTTQYFVARTCDGEPAGVAGVAYDKKFGYLHALSVLEPYRRHGCGSQLVQARLNHLRENDVMHAFTNVGAKNVGSLKTQAKNGYAPFATIDVWTEDKS